MLERFLTLWTAFVINFLALGLIWAYVMRSYPAFEAARFWTGSAFAAAIGAAIAMLSMVARLADPAIGRRHGRRFSPLASPRWGSSGFTASRSDRRGTALITGVTFAGLAFFMFGYDSSTARILIYSVAQALPLALTLKLLMSRRDGRRSRCPAPRAYRLAHHRHLRLPRRGKILQIGGDFSFVQFDAPQSIAILALMFLSIAFMSASC